MRFSFGTVLVFRLIFMVRVADPPAARRTMPSPPSVVNTKRRVRRHHGSYSCIDLTATAVDLLHTDEIDIFCIASGDQDFTGLVRGLQSRRKKAVRIGLRCQSAKTFRRNLTRSRW